WRPADDQHAPAPAPVRTILLRRVGRIPAAGTVAADLGHDPGRAGSAGPMAQGTRAIGCAPGAGTRGVHAPGDVVAPRGADVDRPGDPGAGRPAANDRRSLEPHPGGS